MKITNIGNTKDSETKIAIKTNSIVSLDKCARSQSIDLAAMLLEIIPTVMTHIRSEYRQQRQDDLTITHFRLLANIWKQPMTNKELAEIIGLSIPAMSRCVQNLEQKGLLIKTAKKHDRRNYEIALTHKGLKLIDSIHKRVVEIVSLKLHRLPNKDKKNLKQALIALSQSFS